MVGVIHIFVLFFINGVWVGLQVAYKFFHITTCIVWYMGWCIHIMHD